MSNSPANVDKRVFSSWPFSVWYLIILLNCWLFILSVWIRRIFFFYGIDLKSCSLTWFDMTMIERWAALTNWLLISLFEEFVQLVMNSQFISIFYFTSSFYLFLCSGASSVRFPLQQNRYPSELVDFLRLLLVEPEDLGMQVVKSLHCEKKIVKKKSFS